ncbi:SPOR domain-containing protein [Phreatobacter aquaticus]|nr:SPOR domain-containing protein [Phreatobacter aquaticus]
MANDSTVRSYRDYDAYERQDEPAEPVRRAPAGDPLAELARIMGQDNSYADLLKSVARTRGDAARTEPTFESAPPLAAGADHHDDADEIDIPAMPLSGAGEPEAVDWDDLEAELETYARSGAGHHPAGRPAAAPAPGAEAVGQHEPMFDEDEDRHVAAPASEGLRGTYQPEIGNEIDELERLLREHDAAAQPSGHGRQNEAYAQSAGIAPYAVAGAAAVGLGAAAWQVTRPAAVAAPASEPAYADDAHVPARDIDYSEPVAPRRRRAGVTAVLAVVGLSVLGGGGVLGYRALTGSAGMAGEPRTVRANPEPVRVPVQQAQDPKPVTDRVPGGERVVSREERPVTPREQASQVQVPPQPRVIPLATAPAAPTPAPIGSVIDPGQPPIRNVQAVPVPGGSPQSIVALRQTGPEPINPGEEPRRVRTVPVGPDNALSGQALRPAVSSPLVASPSPVSSLPVSSPSPMSVVPSAPAQPQAAAPALAAADARPASAPAPQPRPVVTQRIIPPAQAEANRQQQAAQRSVVPAANAPLSLAPQRTAALAPQQTQAAPVTTASTSGSGSFVQISSHQSESEARNAFASAQRRYSVLQGRQPNIRSAEIPGRGTWHRLRVGPFSRAEAQSFCERLKSSGGSCVIN